MKSGAVAPSADSGAMNERTGRFALASLAAFFGAVLILLGAGACEAVRREKTVALTFDDGPHGEKTLELLKVLSDDRVKASFFVVGKQVAFNRQVLRRIRDMGHTIANHSYTHPNLTELSPAAARDEYAACSELIRDVTGQTPRFCRPPGGRTNAAVERAGREAGLQTVYWTVNSRDYTDLPPEEIARKVAALVRPGGVVLLHGGVTATIEALPAIIRDLRKKGYRFVTLDELFPAPESHKAGIRRRGGSGS